MAKALTCCLATVFLLLGACSGTDEATDGGSAVTLLAFGEPEELAAYRALIDAYQRAEPGTTVDLIEASDRDDLLARLATSFSGGNPPDLFLVNYRFFVQFAAKGALEPLGPRLSSSDSFSIEDFYPEALDAFRFEGQLTCLPQNVSSLVVYYNRKLFQEAGVDEPRAGWTWDEMVDVARRLTRDTDRDGATDQYGLGVEPTIVRLAPFVWSNGGEVYDAERNQLTLGAPAAREALQRFLDLRSVHGVVPTLEEVKSEDDEARFLNGRTAMILSSRRSTPTFRTITEFDWDVAPIPVHDQPANVLHSDAYCMTARSEQKDEAWRFLEYAIGTEGARLVARTGRTVPSIRSVAASEDFLLPKAKPERARVFLDAIPSLRRLPTLSTWPEVEDAADQVLEAAFYRGTDAATVVQQIEEQTAGPLSRAEPR